MAEPLGADFDRLKQRYDFKTAVQNEQKLSELHEKQNSSVSARSQTKHGMLNDG